MPIRIECPKCRKSLSAPDHRAGTNAKCPACGTPFAIPPAFKQDFADTPVFAKASPDHHEAPYDERNCPYCHESIKIEATKCKHCGEFLDGRVRAQESRAVVSRYHNEQEPSPGVAAVLSLVIPGAGQMYRGNIGIGFLWLICVTIGYLLCFPGVVLHILCVVMAASGGNRRR